MEKLTDTCPFSVLALFNRSRNLDENRTKIAQELASFLKVKTPVPNFFYGIPTVNNQSTYFFAHKYQRSEDDIDNLWNLFEKAIEYTDNEKDSNIKKLLYEAYDIAAKIKNVGEKLPIGLHWIRPWKYLNLDKNTQNYITKELLLKIEKNGPKKKCNSQDYFSLIDNLKNKFQDKNFPIDSFPQLSFVVQNQQSSFSSIAI